MAVRQARLHNALAERAEYLERLARTDPLTGLADRRTFDQMLELEVARAVRQGSPLAVALFDVDALTEIIAAHGASVGDDVLRNVAATIADKVRLIDTVARIGEDVFGVIAPGDAGGIVARRVQDAVAALPPVGPVQASVSAAVVHHPADGETGGGPAWRPPTGRSSAPGPLGRARCWGCATRAEVVARTGAPRNRRRPGAGSLPCPAVAVWCRGAGAGLTLAPQTARSSPPR